MYYRQKIAKLEDVVFKRFYTFSNELLTLHDIFSSESQHKLPKPTLLYLRIIYTCIKVKLTEGEKEMASP